MSGTPPPPAPSTPPLPELPHVVRPAGPEIAKTAVFRLAAVPPAGQRRLSALDESPAGARRPAR